MAHEYPHVGVGVYVKRDGKMLLGKRRGIRGTDTWSVPGGKIELYESPEQCARRELMEETGLEVGEIRFLTFSTDVYQEYDEHWITLAFVTEWKSGEPQVLEPNKMTDWGWYAWNALPQPLLRSTRNFVDSGYNPFTI